MPDIKKSLPNSGVSTEAFAGAPKSLVDLYHKEYQKHRDNGIGHNDAHNRAIRMTQHAGWYKGQKGWKQFTPDLQKKVNIREAVKQPDGKYVIEDVEVFYPNAVKGKNQAYSADDIRQIIKNTNRSIESGGQKPGILEGHPHADQAMSGIQPYSHGFGVNWRENKSKPGWAVCDLIDVEPEYVDKLKHKKLTGLSAGFAKDAGTNKRFGHVALLGGSTQALSSLPTHEIFSSSRNYLCFSADEESFNLKGSKMSKMSEKQAACYSAMCGAKDAYDAAFKSFEVGEPDADKKMEEAYNAIRKASQEFSGEFDIANVGSSVVSGGKEAVPDKAEGIDTKKPEPISPLMTEGKFATEESPVIAPPNEMTHPNPSFEADPVAAFTAAQEEISILKTSVSQALNAIKSLATNDKALRGRMEKQSFDAEVIELKRQNFAVPANIEEQFSNCLENPDPSKSIKSLMAGLRSLPKISTPASTETQFAAGGEKPVAGKASAKAQANVKALKEVRESLGNISDEDMKYAALAESIESK